MRTVACAAALAWLTFCLSGCDEPAGPATVRGKVRYLGTVVPDARIVFIPDESRGTHGEILRAQTAGDGTFVLQPDGPTGIPPGCYRITVMALETVATSSTMPRSLLPDRYRDPELSELSCEIQAGQDNDVMLDLK